MERVKSSETFLPVIPVILGEFLWTRVPVDKCHSEEAEDHVGERETSPGIKSLRVERLHRGTSVTAIPATFEIARGLDSAVSSLESCPCVPDPDSGYLDSDPVCSRDFNRRSLCL